MTEILNDLSPQALTAAIEDNMYATTPLSHDWPDMETLETPEICWCLTDVAFPTCNAVFNARLDPDKIDGIIESVIAKGKERNVPRHWWIGRNTSPDNLGECLLAHGFTQIGDGAAGMAIDLRAINEGIDPPPGLEIIEVGDDEALKTWCHVTRVGFDIPEHAEPALFQWFSTDIKLGQPLKCYLGVWQGKPVATSGVFYGAGVAGIYFVATLPEARNRGIGFAVTQKPLLEAREKGYRAGILQASQMGKPVYLRMGFKEYSTIGSYSWLPQGPDG